MNRHFFFRNYWWLALLFAGIGSLFAVYMGGEQTAGLVGASVAGALGFCYFVQQQKLAETALFHQLFAAFNARYNALNGQLAALLSRPADSLSVAERGAIVDYFNLCAEEYLFYRQGYIHENAWRSWCRGMSWYLKRHPFVEIWHEEVQTESFYGLTREAINEGAA